MAEKNKDDEAEGRSCFSAFEVPRAAARPGVGRAREESRRRRRTWSPVPGYLRAVAPALRRPGPAGRPTPRISPQPRPWSSLGPPGRPSSVSPRKSVCSSSPGPFPFTARGSPPGSTTPGPDADSDGPGPRRPNSAQGPSQPDFAPTSGGAQAERGHTATSLDEGSFDEKDAIDVVMSHKYGRPEDVMDVDETDDVAAADDDEADTTDAMDAMEEDAENRHPGREPRRPVDTRGGSVRQSTWTGAR